MHEVRGVEWSVSRDGRAGDGEEKELQGPAPCHPPESWPEHAFTVLMVARPVHWRSRLVHTPEAQLALMPVVVLQEVPSALLLSKGHSGLLPSQYTAKSHSE